MMFRIAPFFVFAAALAFPFSAQAQFAFGGDGPTKIDADRAEYKGELTILTGQVQVVQDTARILAEKMNIYREDLGGGRLGAIVKIEAIGDFFYITPEEKVSGERGLYEQALDRITVTGDVTLEDSAGNVGSGNRLVYNLSQKEAVLDGTCKGRSCKSGRANIIIEQQPRQQGN